ncbi:tRNA-bin [Deinococcus phoenicis]|uniref:tRNA-bin n=2 Tax=Deinococcus phoenicis TaxID=1476583 RepID=A0A016QME5_9DEIO|nr:tRNA-bin [Deinococcus phoenicis]
MMATELKETVTYEETLGQLDIRLGRVVGVALEPSAPKPAYRLTVDFGKYGRRVSVGRFTQHTLEELLGQQVVGVLNFEARQVGEVMSEVLILGVQVPGAASGEATFLTPERDAKLGSKVF